MNLIRDLCILSHVPLFHEIRRIMSMTRDFNPILFVLIQAEDYIDEILNGESYADSLKYDANAMADIRIKEEPQVFSEAEAKDRQKKDNHNMSKIEQLFRMQ